MKARPNAVSRKPTTDSMPSCARLAMNRPDHAEQGHDDAEDPGSHALLRANGSVGSAALGKAHQIAIGMPGRMPDQRQRHDQAEIEGGEAGSGEAGDQTAQNSMGTKLVCTVRKLVAIASTTLAWGRSSNSGIETALIENASSARAPPIGRAEHQERQGVRLQEGGRRTGSRTRAAAARNRGRRSARRSGPRRTSAACSATPISAIWLALRSEGSKRLRQRGRLAQLARGG